MENMLFDEMNSLGNEWSGIAANEEIEIYKERLQELEIAFRYNLHLLSERDAELDVLEEQLRDGITQLERVSQEKAECEEFAKRLNDERRKEAVRLKQEIVTKDKIIMELDRKNEGNMKTLRKTLHDLKKEQEKQSTKLAVWYKRQRLELEKKFFRIIQLKEANHSEELNELNRKCMLLLDELADERLRTDAVQADNRNLRKNIIKIRKESEEKEKSYAEQIEQLHYLYRRVSEELEIMIETGEGKCMKVEKKEMAAPEVVTSATQTVPEDREEVDRREFLMIKEQNNVLKSIIKNLKRAKAQETESVSCSGCLQVKNKIDEVNRKFESEVSELRKALAMDISQRLEEENIIGSLENSVVCLKEKLIASLRQNLENIPDGDLCSYTFGRAIENEIQVCLMEDRLCRKMEAIAAKVLQEGQSVDGKLAKMKSDLESRLLEILPEKEVVRKLEQDLRSLQRKLVRTRLKPETEGKEVGVPGLTGRKMSLNAEKIRVCRS